MSTVQEIAESYINGNQGWVKNKLKDNPDLLAQVYAELKEYNKGESEKFMRWITMWD